MRHRHFTAVQTAHVRHIWAPFVPGKPNRETKPGCSGTYSAGVVFQISTWEVRMRVSHGILALAITLTVAPIEIAAAHGGGSASGGSVGAAGDLRSASPEQQAKDAYNSGVRSIKKAQEYDSDAAKASSPEKAAKAQDKARQAYSKAL